MKLPQFVRGSGDPLLDLVEVGPLWAERFTAERQRLAAALGAAAKAIEHIGSTAVPALRAKPVLDLAIGIESFEAGAALVPTIVALGYVYRGENGIPRRHYFKRAGAVPVHLHVLELNGPQWLRHLTFRDRLRADRALAERYVAVKQAAVAAAAGDRARYQALKAAFIGAVCGA